MTTIKPKKIARVLMTFLASASAVKIPLRYEILSLMALVS